MRPNFTGLFTSTVYQYLLQRSSTSAESLEELNRKEEQWIAFYGCAGRNGYNITAGGSWHKAAHNDEAKAKLREYHRNRRVQRLSFIEIKERYSAGESLSSLAKDLRCSRAIIQNLLRENGIVLRQDKNTRAKTHCKRGHEYTEENTLWRKNGMRSCGQCKREDNLEYWHSLPKEIQQARTRIRTKRRKKRDRNRSTRYGKYSLSLFD
jgi:hypothetical protein